MALFLLICTDKAGARDVRLATRDTHLAYLGAHAAKVKVAGALLDDGGAPVGSMLIVEADDAEALRAFAADDPYAKAGLFETVEIKPWRLAVGGFQ